MSLDLLLPVNNEAILGLSMLPKQVVGKNIDIHTVESGLPELKGLEIAIIGLSEQRNSFFANPVVAENRPLQKDSFRNWATHSNRTYLQGQC